jgi:hypothetical protein
VDRPHRDSRCLSVETTKLDVRHYGTTAIVRCAQRSRASWRGEEMALAVRLRRVWIQEPDGWQLVAIQFSTLGIGRTSASTRHPGRHRATESRADSPWRRSTE